MMKKIFKKVLAAVLVLATMLMPMALAACGNDDRDPAHLTMWAGGEWTSTMGERLEEMVQDFNKNQAKSMGFDITLRIVSDMETRFSTAIRKNEQPDILIWDRFNTPTYSKQNLLLEIEDLISRDGVDTGAFLPQAMQELTYDNHVYGLPLDLDVWGIYVNTDMVSQYNAGAAEGDKITLNTDWTWEDLASIAKKLVKRDGKNMTQAGYSSHDLYEHFYKFMVSAGVDFLDASGKPNFNNDRVKDILKYFVELYGSNVSQTGLTEKSNFTNGTLAMINQATYFADFIKTNKPTLNYKFMPQPRYSKEGGVNGGMIGGFGIAFPKPNEKYKTEKWEQRKENAWKFTKWWLCDKQNMLDWSAKTNTLPALLSTHEDDIVKNNALLSGVLEYLPNYRIRPQLTGYLMMQTNVFNSTLQSFITKGKTDAESINSCIFDLIDGCENEMLQ